ncbi:unnamed protein product [Caenorhabditis angaria]|uniref:Uncharacterized protein n=1 Tax=Caenorhabditis angaria TaxID=860376 RepID=A0A9P1N134_9PELO|nr:unnamed protein product [Caenorhabditis angaria]
MTTRLGLSQLSSSARNSPFGEKIVDKTKLASLEPVKIAAFRKYKPVTPSPLATTPTESTQKFELYKSIDCQTIVTVSKILPEIKKEDLVSKEPTVNYIQNMVFRIQQEIDEEIERNLKLNNQLADIKEEINRIDKDLEVLREVIEEIEQEKQHVGTSDV